MNGSGENVGRWQLKRVAVWAGRGLLVVSLIYLGLELQTHWTATSAWRPTTTDVAWIGFLAACYALALGLIVEGWHQIVGIYGPEPRRRTYPSFAITQIAKYLPGNVAHLFGRGLYLRNGPLSSGQIVKATLLELAIIPLAALICVLAAGTAGLAALQFPFVPTWLWPSATLLFLTALLLIAALLLQKNILSVREISRLGRATLLATAFMICLGVAYALTFRLLGDGPLGELAVVAIVAWLVGFLTPGAPGGLGTREATVVLLLGHLHHDNAVILSAAAFRVITVLGDCLLFAAGWAAFRSRPDQQAAGRDAK